MKRPSLFLLFFLLIAPLGLRAEPFPLYEEIRPNVEFWQQIYSRYYSTQGLLHDSYDLSLVYTVLEVENTWDNAARQRTRRTISDARERYRAVLLHLAAGGAPRNAEERRVKALFGPEPTPARLRRAANNIRFQRGMRDRFQEGVIRSGAYLEQIKGILREHGLPEDLAYLPHVESSFNYEAYSRLGAAGIWQFMPATGRQYLTIDYVLDERRDPIRASHAAARLLGDNLRRLGDWPLAITAYNHGANGMARAKAQHGDYPTIFRHYEGSRFGFASRNFYAEFLAARQVAKNAERHFGPLQREPERRSHEIELTGYLPLSELARHLQLEITTLRRYNPGLREPVFRGEKYLPRGYRLRVPDTPATVRLAAALPGEIFAAEQKRSAFYTVQRGDTAGQIARRHRVSLSALIAANQLDRRATIYAGQNLRIPGLGEEAILLAAASKEPRPAREEPPVLVAAAPPLEPAATPPDEDLIELALAEPSPDSVAALPVEQAGEPAQPAIMSAGGLMLASARLNGLAPGVGGETTDEAIAAAIAAVAQRSGGADGEVAPAVLPLLGTRVALALSGDGGRLPAREPVVEDVLAAALPEINPGVVAGHIRVERVWQTADGRRLGTIRVEVEETLGHYADWLGVRAQDLRRLNGFSFSRPIRFDQRLTIPLDRVEREVFEELRYEFHKAMEEDFFAAFRVEGAQSYEVRRGDNIWQLSRDQFELPLWLIRKYNPELNLDNLRPGQQIMIPQLAARGGTDDRS
ncbi:LysM peptidoglycan-binding domain-containing protein [Desulfurivibrio sp. D14AmB]|uniref:LysM peptidoglycan-binding domain-containing protein n=1 Tax=Desulfurivibrio sp. D14AmB TaxID=3374370 RepID=UPI00376F432C